MPLIELNSKVKRQSRKRVGRGNGSGHGTYCGKGQKGQTSRSGGKRRPGFEGGQTPLVRKMPKLKGFKNINTIDYLAINVGNLESSYKKTELDLTNGKKPVKLLGDGEVSKAFKIKVNKASKSAIEKIEKAGGSVETTARIKEEKTDKPNKKAKEESAPQEPKKEE